MWRFLSPLRGSSVLWIRPHGLRRGLHSCAAPRLCPRASFLRRSAASACGLYSCVAPRLTRWAVLLCGSAAYAVGCILAPLRGFCPRASFLRRSLRRNRFSFFHKRGAEAKMASYPDRCQHLKINGTQCGSPAPVGIEISGLEGIFELIYELQSVAAKILKTRNLTGRRLFREWFCRAAGAAGSRLQYSTFWVSK